MRIPVVESTTVTVTVISIARSVEKRQLSQHENLFKIQSFIVSMMQTHLTSSALSAAASTSVLI